MNLPPPKICQRIRQLFASMGSPNANEAGNARDMLTKLLAKHSLSWNDLPAILAATEPKGAGNAGAANAHPSAPQGPTSAPEVNPLDLTLYLIDEHIAVTAEERMAVALWILHTYVFDQFTITPRLALLSPLHGCGKTTLLVLLELLVKEPFRTDNTTPAPIYHSLSHRIYSLLIDEGDNLGLLSNHTLRSLFNSGHRRGGRVTRYVGGWSQDFPTFAPLAVAAIGTMPLPLQHRSVLIRMRRHAPGEAPLHPLDELCPTFPAVREQIEKWAATCAPLARDPAMPPSLHNRASDNWRVLLAIADNLGHGDEARAAAIALCANRPDEDPKVVLLTDIRTVFQTREIDRISSEALVAALLALDDGFWNEWRGDRDDRPPRKLTQGELARLLRAFDIRPRTIWPLRRQPGDRSSRGYLRHQFERAWRSYCPPSDTPTQSSVIRYLRRT